jgi:hypothetical protein
MDLDQGGQNFRLQNAWFGTINSNISKFLVLLLVKSLLVIPLYYAEKPVRKTSENIESELVGIRIRRFLGFPDRIRFKMSRIRNTVFFHSTAFLGVFVLETEIVTGGDGERGDHSVGLMDTDQENRVGPSFMYPHHVDTDPDSAFYLMRIRIRLFTLMRIRIQILASKKRLRLLKKC